MKPAPAKPQPVRQLDRRTVGRLDGDACFEDDVEDWIRAGYDEKTAAREALRARLGRRR